MGCSTPTTPKGMKLILNDYRLVWLSKNLDRQEKDYLSGWLKESLIPYVAELENQ